MECQYCYKEYDPKEPNGECYAMHLPSDKFYDETVVELSHSHKSCARRYMLDIHIIPKYKPAFDILFRKMNSTCVDHDGITTDAFVELFFNEHRYLQQELINFLRKCFDKIGRVDTSRYTDARNEYAIAWCKQAAALAVQIDRKF